MFHRESGYYKTSYQADMALYPLPIGRYAVAGFAVLFFIICPLFLGEYYLSIINLIAIASVGDLGLNILVGYTGQLSIGHAAFMSVGAYTAANLATKLDWPFWLTVPAGGAMAALIGAIVGIPSLRIKGIYLAIATLAAQFIIEWVINHSPAISGGVQASIEMPRPEIFGAIFIVLLPIVIRLFMETFGTLFVDDAALAQIIAQLRLIIFSGLIIVFLVLEPDGLNKLWQNIRNYFRVWPFSY